MKIKTRTVICTIEDEYVEIEVLFDNRWWYYLEQYVDDNLLDMINEFREGKISLFTFCNDFFFSVSFLDEDDNERAFSASEWGEILDI